MLSKILDNINSSDKALSYNNYKGLKVNGYKLRYLEEFDPINKYSKIFYV